jgi:hypothetical protein
LAIDRRAEGTFVILGGEHPSGERIVRCWPGLTELSPGSHHHSSALR